MKDKKYFEIYRCYPDGKVEEKAFTIVSGIDEKEAWGDFAFNELYKYFPEDASFIAKEVVLTPDQIAVFEDICGYRECFKNGDYTDITGQPL